MSFHRLFHFLWNFSKKRTEVIDGKSIKYLITPNWIPLGIGGSKKLFTGGYVLVHKPSKNLMIFVSKKESLSINFELTLYHEYYEGLYLLGNITELEGKKLMRKHWGPFFKDLEHACQHKPLNAKADLDKKIKNNEKAHVFALMMESSLAKEMLPRDDYILFMEYIVLNRL
jgi:hypothetical protein